MGRRVCLQSDLIEEGLHLLLDELDFLSNCLLNRTQEVPWYEFLGFPARVADLHFEFQLLEYWHKVLAVKTYIVLGVHL